MTPPRDLETARRLAVEELVRAELAKLVEEGSMWDSNDPSPEAAD